MSYRSPRVFTSPGSSPVRSQSPTQSIYPSNSVNIGNVSNNNNSPNRLSTPITPTKSGSLSGYSSLTPKGGAYGNVNDDFMFNYVKVGTYRELASQLASMYRVLATDQRDKRDAGIYTDITVQTDGLKVPAHKFILQSSLSEYFKTIIGNPSWLYNSSTINIDSIDPIGLKLVLDVIYGAQDSSFASLTLSDFWSMMNTLRRLNFPVPSALFLMTHLEQAVDNDSLPRFIEYIQSGNGGDWSEDEIRQFASHTTEAIKNMDGRMDFSDVDATLIGYLISSAYYNELPAQVQATQNNSLVSQGFNLNEVSSLVQPQFIASESSLSEGNVENNTSQLLTSLGDMETNNNWLPIAVNIKQVSPYRYVLQSAKIPERSLVQFVFPKASHGVPTEGIVILTKYAAYNLGTWIIVPIEWTVQGGAVDRNEPELDEWMQVYWNDRPRDEDRPNFTPMLSAVLYAAKDLQQKPALIVFVDNDNHLHGGPSIPLDDSPYITIIPNNMSNMINPNSAITINDYIVRVVEEGSMIPYRPARLQVTILSFGYL